MNRSLRAVVSLASLALLAAFLSLSGCVPRGSTQLPQGAATLERQSPVTRASVTEPSVPSVVPLAPSPSATKPAPQEPISATPPRARPSSTAVPSPGVSTATAVGFGATLSGGPASARFTPTRAADATLQPSAQTAPSPAGHKILHFSASPTAVYPGETVTITWEVEGDASTTLRLDTLEQWGSLSDWYVMLDSPQGSIRVSTNPDLREFQPFFLHVVEGVGEWGDSATANITLLCPDEWLFADGPSDRCPIWTIRTRVVAQRFERGLMLWTEVDRTVYVLPDGESWRADSDNWHEGMPASDPALVPPAGLLQPVRGFGLAWRTWQGAREALGWATGEEFVVDEGFVQQAFAYGKHVAGGDRFISGPDGVALCLPQRMVPHTWYEWKGREQ